MVNIAEEPYRAFFTFVSCFRLYAFCEDESCIVLVTNATKYMTKKPYIDERKHIEDFFTVLYNFLIILSLNIKGDCYLEKQWI